MSPDLIVLPLLPLETFEQRTKFEQWIKLMPAITIGSGLGRDPKLLDRFDFVLDSFKDKIVIGDADFFWYLTQGSERYKKSLSAIKQLVLTPNRVELERLFKYLLNKELNMTKVDEIANEIARFNSDVFEVDINILGPELKSLFDYFDGGNSYFILKGSYDIILSQSKCLIVKNKASLKRSGGQGDLLSGLATLYSLWSTNQNVDGEFGLAFASFINRRASYEAFKKKKLGMVAEDMLDEVTEIINEFITDMSVFKDDSLYGFTRL